MNDGSTVLVVAALPEELDAARNAGAVDAWEERRADGSMPYLWGELRTSGGGRLSVALARPAGMGGRATAPYVTGLVDRLRPACVVMSGVCAGNPDETALGDVVVAEPVYEWDEGKLSERGFAGDHRQFRLEPRWARTAQDLDPTTLPSYREATTEESLLWLLERLHRGHDPRTRPARGRYFPPGTWGTRLDLWEAEGWIARDLNGAPRLTDAGSELVQRRLYDDVDGPRRLPFAVHVAPMASGSAVLSDVRIWKLLGSMGVRKIAAVELEGATIATIAHERKIPWLVAKGVMDHADAHKDDRYKQFAARASAEVLFALLDRLASGPHGVTPRAAEPPGANTTLVRLDAVVSALLTLPVILDPQQRRVVLDLLPQSMGSQVPEHSTARVHVVALVRTCQRFPNGAQALLEAVRLASGDGSPELDRLAAVMSEHWP
jgi:nucleoside phosphorylase